MHRHARSLPAPQRLDDLGGTPDRLLTAGEVAAMLAVPERWVREHPRSGLIPHVSLGRYRRYRREAVLAWLADQERGGAAWRKHRPVPNGGTKRARDRMAPGDLAGSETA